MDKKDWFRSFVELVIIFIGVYGAFLLNNYRQQNQIEEARLKFYQSFLYDLKRLDSRTDALIIRIQNTIKKAEAAKPDELPYSRYLAFPNTLYIIESAYKGKNFESLSLDYLISIEIGANLMKHIEKRFQILDKELRKYMLFKENDLQNGHQFKNWYVNELEFIMQLMQRLGKMIEEGALPATKKLVAEMK